MIPEGSVNFKNFRAGGAPRASRAALGRAPLKPWRRAGRHRYGPTRPVSPAKAEPRRRGQAARNGAHCGRSTPASRIIDYGWSRAGIERPRFSS